MSLHWYGDRALLLDTASPLTLGAAVQLAAPVGLVDVVPGAASVLVCFTGPAQATAALVGLRSLQPVEAALTSQTEVVVLPTVYDGADLDHVAAATGCSVAQVVSRHSTGRYVVAVTGFTPGFGYLSGLDRVLHLPRRAEPRTVVPAGSVAIADRWTGVYPVASPGGWHLLGHTAAVLWDLDRDPPTLLRPGVQVRFEPVR